MQSNYNEQILDYQDFSNKCLIGIQFKNCSIRFCKFNNSDISYAKFESCDLYNTTFQDSVLYFTRIIDCDATKAKFKDAFLNGIRIKDTVITYAEFGITFNTNKERKSVLVKDVGDDFFKCAIGTEISQIRDIENNFKGIYLIDSNIAIKFIDTDDSDSWRRKSEVALQIKKITEENGYTDKALNYYFLHRKFLRKSFKSKFHRFFDYVFNELFWGYGVRIINPVITFFVNCIFFSIVYSLLPIFDFNSGIRISDKIIIVFNGNFHTGILAYLEILYSSILISSLSLFGNIDVAGFGKPFVILHVLISVLLIGLGLSALSKKLANT